MKRILYFMPRLSVKHTAGNMARVVTLTRYFKQQGFQVDFFGIKNWGISWNDNIPSEMISTGLVDNVYWGEIKPMVKGQRLKRMFSYSLPEIFNRWYYNVKPSIFNKFFSFYLRRSFNNVLKKNKYDYIVVNYALWGNLIKDNKYTNGTKTIVDTHDLMTIPIIGETKRKDLIGKTFQEEISLLSCFDEVWAVSMDEYYIFTQFLTNKVRLFPATPLTHATPKQLITKEKKEYDLLFVGSRNPWNKISIEWFISDVYPLLPSDLTICIVGKVNEFLKDDYTNIKKLDFVEDLADVYSKTKISICPMLEGSGVKVKVLEALSFGLPVVCTLRGIDGLPNKVNNGCLVSMDAPEFAANIKKLLADDSLYSQLSKQGYDLYKSYFDFEVYKNMLNSVFGVNSGQE